MLNPLMTGIWYLVQLDGGMDFHYAENDREGLESDWFEDGEFTDEVDAIYKIINGQLHPQDLDDWADEINAETVANDNHNRSLRGPQ